MSDVTRLLTRIEQGDATAAERLVPLVYEELRKLAAAKLAHEKAGQTLQATALVHEAYLRLLGPERDAKFRGRGHFIAAAAEAMRRILIERARQKMTARRGGGLKRRALLEPDCAIDPGDKRLLDLDEALASLLEQQPTVGQLVKLRYFGGLTISQAAATLNLSERTAKRYWVYAKAWLKREMDRDTLR